MSLLQQAIRRAKFMPKPVVVPIREHDTAPVAVSVQHQTEPEIKSPDMTFELHLVPKESPWIKDIIEETIRFYNVKRLDFFSHRREGVLPTVRHIAMYLCRELTMRSVLVVGRAMGRDHSTVIHGVRKIEARLAWDERLADELQLITMRVNERAAVRRNGSTP